MIQNKIKSFLTGITDVSYGYSEINFVQSNELESEQTGYSIDPEGNSLVTGNDGDWQAEWVVIANDNSGDPIIVDTHSPALTVLTAVHGENSWETFIIADSLDNFKTIISNLNSISKNRNTPVELDENPLPDKEKIEILEKIKKQNPNSELWYWEDIFDNA